jgi:cobalt-zinc-cadmium efflux system membrane fusion protein
MITLSPYLHPRVLIRLGVVLAVLVGAVLAWQNWPSLQAHLHTETPNTAQEHEAVAASRDQVEAVPGRPDAIRIPEKLLNSKRFATASVIDAPNPEPLRLQGTTVPDPNRSIRIHTPFSGTLVKMGLQGEMAKTSERLSDVPANGLRVGDRVMKGQTLAVVWSKDVGTMKTDLLNQMSKLRNDRIILDRYLAAENEKPGVLTKTMLTQAQQAVEADQVAVNNAILSLRSYQFTEEEIAVVVAAGEKVRDINAPLDVELGRTWAEFHLRAPYDAFITEQNASVGLIVDPTLDLFKLAKLDRLQVLANVYEEDIPKLHEIDREAQAAEAEAVPPGGTAGSEGMEGVVREAGNRVRAWTISFQSTGGPGEPGAFEKIGLVIDPNQHTGTVTGWVDNRNGRLVMGQFVTATVPLKKDPNLVAVPAGAVVELGETSLVFVQTSPGVFERRKVEVVSRGRTQIYIHRPLPGSLTLAGPAGLFGPIPVGAIVLARGVVELNEELNDLQSDAKK